MVRPSETVLACELDTALVRFSNECRLLPGITEGNRRFTLVEQMIESIRRVDYVAAVLSRDVSSYRADPNSTLFDPLKAAIHFQRQGCEDEAFWMVFLFVHFGRHSKGGWRYAREVYGCLGSSHRWNWANTSADIEGFRVWLETNQSELQNSSEPGGFGNHRKYQSLDARKQTGTGSAFATYVQWVDPGLGHAALMKQVLDETQGDPNPAFDKLYRSMAPIASFGRTARFDYLTMIAKLGLAPIEPGSPYLVGSSGPLTGARLLFGENNPTMQLEQWVIDLGGELGLGMQVLEDSLCNWQKSPDQFKPFRG